MQSGQTTPRKKAGPARTTIVDLAEHLGLAKGTVSRALNGYPDISDGTRMRVRKAADQLGYRPLSHAQAIRTGRVRSIGLVLQMNEHDGHRPFVADFLAGLSEAASAEDWTLTVGTASNDEETLSLLDRLTQEKKADGFILPRTRLDDPRINLLRESGTPFVLYGRTRDSTGCAWFDIESEAAMEEAVVTLFELGHRRIGFVPGAEGYTYAQLRRDGYLAGLSRCGLKFDPNLVATPAVGRRDGAEAVASLLALSDTPTAVICSVDGAAHGTYDVARKHGLKIGEDLSVISYDGAPEAQFLEPALSTYTVDVRAAGERLANLLIRRCRGEDVETLRAIVKPTFRHGGSHGPAPVLN